MPVVLKLVPHWCKWEAFARSQIIMVLHTLCSVVTSCGWGRTFLHLLRPPLVVACVWCGGSCRVWDTLRGCGVTDRTDSALDKVRDQNTFGVARVSLVWLHCDLALRLRSRYRSQDYVTIFYPHFSDPAFSSRALGTLGVSLLLQAHCQDRRSWMCSVLTGPECPFALPPSPPWNELALPSSVLIWPRCSGLDESQSCTHVTCSLLPQTRPALFIWYISSLFAFCGRCSHPHLPQGATSRPRVAWLLTPGYFLGVQVPVTGATSWDLCRLLWDQTSLPGDQAAAVSLTHFLCVTLKT